MTGTLFGVGVGPGDPMLMTLKAVEVLKACPVVAVPAAKKEDSVAYKIASGAVDLSGKTWAEIPMPMTGDRQQWERSHSEGARILEGFLQQGLDVAFLTLGDPTVYSTYGYLQKRIGRLGYETEIISGVPSFCAAAAKLGIPLAEGSQQLHVIPAGYRLEESMDLTGTKVYMKAGSRMAALKEHLQEVPGSVYMVENCGMEGEKLCRCAKELDETAGYYSIVLVKEEKDV